MHYNDIENIEKHLTILFRKHLDNSKILVYLYQFDNDYLFKAKIITDSKIDFHKEELIQKELIKYLKEHFGIKSIPSSDICNGIEVSKKDMENYLTLIKMKGV